MCPFSRRVRASLLIINLSVNPSFPNEEGSKKLFEEVLQERGKGVAYFFRHRVLN